MAEGIIGSRFGAVYRSGWAGLLRRVRYRIGAPRRHHRQVRWVANHVGGAGRAAPFDRARVDAELEGAPFFFASDACGLPEEFSVRLPDARAALLAQADAVLEGDLSWVVPSATRDWHRALPGSGRWPLERAAALAVGAEQPLGDVRLAWEVGRCTHLVRLAQAAWLTGEKRYSDAALAGLHDFASQNPPGLGIAWLHAQEAALRSIAWVWVMRLVSSAGPVDDETLALWLAQLRVHGEFVEAYLSDAPVTHNHLVSEASGLFILGTAVPALPGAERWRRMGARLLWREVEKQIDEDGVSGEGSTHYHAFVLDSVIATLLLARVAGEPVPEEVRDRAESMAEFVAWWIRSDGSLPAIGDSDAGRAWRLGIDPLDRRDLLAAAAVAFGRPDWGAISGDAPGAFWLTGGRPVPGATTPLPPGGARSYEAAGLGVARTGWGEAAEIAYVRVGPTRLRRDVLTSHLHADALSVGLRVGDEDVLLDPGTYLYSEGEGWRTHFRRTSAHCCVTVDGADQADVSSSRFGIAGLEPARWIRFEASAGHAVAEAVHPAEGPVQVHRRMVWLAGGTLVLCDRVLGVGEHQVDVWFQLPASRGDAKGASAPLQLDSGRVVRITSLAGADRLRVERGGAGPGPGWRAPRFGALERSTCVAVCAGQVTLPHGVLTIVQTAAPGEALPDVTARSEGDHVCLQVGSRTLGFPAASGVELKLGPGEVA